jgi:murein DD-endopeptidase MepM/ murein hydrolase activator NlpD
VSLISKTFKAYPESPESTIYECFIPIECEEHPNEYVLTAHLIDAPKNSLKLNASVEIVKFFFKEQHSRGSIHVSQDKLNQEKEISMNEKILDQAIGKWTQASAPEKYWNGPFDIPTQAQRLSTPHGEIRVTPERGRYLHRGIDVVNHPKSVIWASQNGKVVIKDRFFITGNTIVLDHGLGVTTLYAHLEDFADIEVGDMVKKGNKIGRIGMTGYATGYHLHWELRVNNVAVDPLEWTKKIY